MSRLLAATITDLRSCKNVIKLLKDQNTPLRSLEVPGDVWAQIKLEIKTSGMSEADCQVLSGVVLVLGVYIIIRARS